MAETTAQNREFKLEKFTQVAITATRENWEETIINQGIFDLDYKRVLDSITGHTDYTDGKAGDYLSYSVVEKGKHNAEAVVSIVHSPKPGPSKGWLKMLEVKLSPEYDESLVLADISKLATAIEIYAAAITGTLALRNVHRAHVVKLYGRNSSLLEFLTALGTLLQSRNLPGVSVSQEGRWLVITKS